MCSIEKPYNRPLFFENVNFTDASYRNMINHHAIPCFRLLQQKYIFHQDGASPYFANRVKDYLTTKRPCNWIERGGPVLWRPRSPDLTPCDFFSLRYLKSKIYSTPVDFSKELKRGIVAVVRRIREETMKKVWDTTKSHLNFIKNVEKGHIEILLN